MVKKHRSLTPAAVLRATLVLRAATVLGAALLLAGCPSPWPRPSTGGNRGAVPPQAAPPSASAPGPIPPAPATPRPQSPPRENHLSPATRSLVTQAHGLFAHRRHRRRLLDPGSGTAHRAEQSAALDRAGDACGWWKATLIKPGELCTQGAGARERRPHGASPGGAAARRCAGGGRTMPRRKMRKPSVHAFSRDRHSPRPRRSTSPESAAKHHTNARRRPSQAR